MTGGDLMSMSKTFKALSDPVRRQILDLLKERPMNAGEIAAEFKVTDATISHHLAVLKATGLIDATRNGTFIYYDINTSLFEEVMNWIMNIRRVENDEEDI